MADQSDHWTTARLTTGEAYKGNQQYYSGGVQRYCALCSEHRYQGGGSMRRIFGMNQWVCKMHSKPKE